MRHLLIVLSAAALVGLAAPASAGSGDEGDELVRLPGQSYPGPGQRKAPKNRHAPEKLVAGGGLIVSFDTNLDGKVTPEELATGIQTAFSEADTNQDGYLSPLEQLAWAERQPVRDDTLGNPARFDPNLDRRASYDEFQTVISSLADDYASESGVIEVSDLKAPRREKRELAENDRPVRPMPRN
jgi:hypothetical protein